MYLPSHTLFQDSHLFLTPTSNFIDILGLACLNAFFFSISLSPPLLIAFRTLVFQGIPAGIASYLGIGLGQICFLVLIYSGLTSIVDFWYSFEPFLFILGCGLSLTLLLHFYNQSLYFDQSRKKINRGDFRNLFQIAGIQFLLILCNPSVSTFHLVSFPINQSVYTLLYFLLFFICFFGMTFAFHYGILFSLEQLSKFATYVPVKGSIFDTKAPFSNRVNNFVCLLGSILIFASLTQYQWRLFFQYVDGPTEILSTRKFHLDYTIDLNKSAVLDFPSNKNYKRNINVQYTSSLPKKATSTSIPNFGFNLYHPTQLAEKPRLRYLIQLKDDSFDLKDIKHKGSNRGLQSDNQRFEGYLQGMDSQKILWEKPALFTVNRAMSRLAKSFPIPVVKSIGLSELETLSTYFGSQEVPQTAYKRYYLNPLQKVRDFFLNSQIGFQKPVTEKQTGEELTKLQLEEARLIYKLAISEIANPLIRENQQLPLDDRRVRVKRDMKSYRKPTKNYSILTQPLNQFDDSSVLTPNPYWHPSL